MEVLLVILSVFAQFFLLRPVTTILHELGHAIPALLLTTGNVSVHIGIPDTRSERPVFQHGRLKFWFTTNPLRWFGGYCVYESPRGRWKSLVILASGVFFTILFVFTAAHISFNWGTHGLLKSLLIVLCFSATIDVFINLIPSRFPVHLPDGRITFNDGAQIRRLFSTRVWMEQSEVARGLMVRGRYEQALAYYRNFLESGWREPGIYGNAALALAGMKRFEDALALFAQYAGSSGATAAELAVRGVVHAQCGLYERALEDLNASLVIRPGEEDVLNNKGYTLIELGRYPESIECFNQVLAQNPRSAYALNNRGYALFRLGNKAAGIADIEAGLSHDADNAYGYRNLGIIRMEDGSPGAAIALFKRAAELNPHTHRLEELLAKAESLIPSTTE